MASRHVVAAADEIPPGGRKIVNVRGRQIGVFNLGGEFFALINVCPHQGAKLCEGAILSQLVSDGPGDYRLDRQGEMIRCPWHCWEFDIRTGQSWCEPNDVKAKTYNVTVEPGGTLAKGPFKAETLSVAVERDYVIVEM